MYFLVGVALGFFLGVKWAMDKNLKVKLAPWIALVKKYINF